MSSDGANGLKPTTTQNDELTRQLTVQLSPEQYERLFFQPHAAKGDLAKRLGKAIRDTIKFDGLTQVP